MEAGFIRAGLPFTLLVFVYEYQDLMKKTEQKALKFIDENIIISEGDNILVALSGGPDSVFLLHLLNKFRKRFNISLGAFHLNHQLRGIEADKDQAFCLTLCTSLKIPFYSASENVKQYSEKNKISLEEAGRFIRYQKLNEIAGKEGYNRIATAHNSNDNTETVLLNIIKGTGIRGISGIPVSRDNIIRPILVLTKEEILDYLHQMGIAFRTDKSNLSDDYERNFLRNKIIPLIKEKLNPSLEKSILSSSAIFRNYLEKVEHAIKYDVKAFSRMEDGNIRIPIRNLAVKKEPELSEFIKFILERNFYIQSTFKDVAGIILLMNRETGTKINLSGNITAARERTDILIFAESTEKLFSPLKIKPGDSVKLEKYTISIDSCIKIPVKFPNNGLVEYISADDLEEEFCLRVWAEGDRFRPLGLKGTKKVSDFLNEQKVDSVSKKNQLVLTNKGKIVWIPGFRIDDRFKIKNSTKKVYKLCLM
jgi:tRNA(Ile)-lysidine synthase